MNTLHSSLRRALAVLVMASSSLTAVAAPDSAGDRAAQSLARHGSVEIGAVGEHVEIGTFLIQVAVMLGRPDYRLADGAWLYSRRQIEGSDAEGMLIVRFAKGRVSSLTIATPAVVARLRSAPEKTAAGALAQR